ncbi:MAG: hypothetical protein ACPLRA_05040, partial [Candidatus Saccharicenans sp.]
MKKKKGLIAFLVVVAFLYVALSFAKTLFLKQLGRRLDKSFEIGELKLSYLPPALTIKNLKSRSDNPSFSVKNLRISITFLALLKSQKPVTVEIFQPTVFYDARVSKPSSGGSGLSLNLPLVIEAGYLNEGQFAFELNQGSYKLSGVSAFFRLESGKLNLLLRASQSRIRPYSSDLVLEGEAEALITTRGKTVNLNRVIIQGHNSAVRLEGKISSLERTRVDLEAVYNLDTQFIMRALNLPFDWGGKTSGQVTISNESGPVIIKSDYNTRDFSLNQVYLGSVEGQVLVEIGRGGQVLAQIKNGNKPVEKVIISYGSGKIEGQMFGFHLEPIMKYASVPWPVASAAWGNFSYSQGQLQAAAEFRDEVETGLVGDKYPFNGQVQINLNLPKKDLKIQSRDLKSPFGRIAIDGQLIIGQLIDLSIRGQFVDIKGARKFT